MNQSSRAFRFEVIPLLETKSCPSKNEISLRFKTTPENLVILSGNVLDRIPLPQAHGWTNAAVVDWIAKIGFPQYQDTFRVNLIDGRTLLLMEARQLVALNITAFSDIRRISSAIHKLHKIAAVTFNPRCVSMGPSHVTTRRTNLLRMMNIIAPRPEYALHWKQLQDHLEHKPPNVDLICNPLRQRT